MKFNKKTPCSECPFRKNAIPGWLGPDNAEEVMLKVHSEGGYPCHMDLEGAPKGADGLADCTGVEQCAGAILHATASCKTYRDPDLNAMQKRLRGDTFPVLDRMEFRAYHAVGTKTYFRSPKRVDKKASRKRA